MKGLFLYSFYHIKSGMKLLLSVLGMLGIVGVIALSFFDSQLLVHVYIGTIFFSISVSSLSSINSDVHSNWSRYEVILPVKRNVIIKAKYLSFIFWNLISLVMTGILTGVVILIKGYKYFDLGLQDIMTIYTVIAALVFMIASYYYSSLYLLGIGKSDIIMTVSILLSIGTLAGEVWLLNINKISIEIGRIIILGVAAILFGLSYIISTMLYQKSET